MSKIGILTWLHNENYGSVLQGYALQKFLIDEGFDAEHIDYNASIKTKVLNLIKNRNSLKLFIEKWNFYQIKKVCKNPNLLKMRSHRFNDFKVKNMRLSERYTNPEELKGTNGKYDITSMSEYKELSISSDLDKFYKFYDCWLNNLRDNKYVYHLDNSVGIEQFVNGINEILKKNGSNEKLDNKAIIQRYMNELKKYTFQGNEIESDFKYEILEANIIADELRKIGYELITFFNGFDNYDQTVVPISTIESLKSIESEIK